MFGSNLQCKRLCPKIPILQWKQGRLDPFPELTSILFTYTKAGDGDDWTESEIYTSELRVQGRGQVPSIVSKDTEVYIM
jgi:hypothetical protein